MHFSESMRFLDKLGMDLPNLGLSRMRRYQKAAGQTEKGFSSLHLAGTNGKGSTAHLLAAALQQHGFDTGLYLSPHSRAFTERIQINGKPISKPAFARELTNAVKRARRNKVPLSYFEYVTACAFSYFSQKADIAVLETGLGGRLDATNVVRPLVSGVTNVSMEHQDWLGNSLSAIAREKAGIIKRGAPFVCGETRPGIARIFTSTARKRKAPLWLRGRDFEAKAKKVSLKGTRFTYKSNTLQKKIFHTSLLGAHQAENASLAIAMLEQLPEAFTPSITAIRKGLSITRVPHRFEVRGKWLLDAAHNPAATARLAETLRTLKLKNLVLVIGISSDKDEKGVLAPLLPFTAHLVVTQATWRGMPGEKIKQTAQRLGFKEVTLQQSVKDALKTARLLVGSKQRVLVTGSLFLLNDAEKVLLEASH